MQQKQATVTLDTNTIGAHHSSTLDASVAGKRIVLHDMLFAEKFNSQQWRTFSVQDLARLAPYVNNVSVDDSLTRLLQAELHSGLPGVFKLDPFNLTNEVRRLITLSAEDPDEAKRHFEASVECVQNEMAKRPAQVYETRDSKEHQSLKRRPFG
jgi:hypothetical protein